jgi:hypothetical protein
MQVAMKAAVFLALLTVSLGQAMPGFAQAPEATPGDSEHLGSVIVFPKFMKGTVTGDGAPRAQTEIEVRARCPKGAVCPQDESVKIKFQWVCPGDDVDLKQICKGVSFEIVLPVDGKAVFNPQDPALTGNKLAVTAPCQAGYLIGWVISATTNRPIKYDGLTGNAVLRDDDDNNGATQSYDAIAIPAEPNLAIRADIATDIDPRTGSPTLVFDGGAGHYQAVDRVIPEEREYDRLSGRIASARAFLILLTLDVRLNRPNYPTFVDLDYRSDEKIDASRSGRNFTCWTEIKEPNLNEYFTLVGARTRSGVVISGKAVKHPFLGISDIPGPVRLLGLAPTDDEGHGRSMDPVYIVKKSDTSRLTTVFVPFD